MLRFKADVRSLGFVLAWFALAAMSWLLWPRFALPVKVGLVGALSVLSWIAAVITHNTLHCPMWKSRTLNRLTQVVLSVSYGFPVTEFIPGHNLSHHRYTQTQKDVMRTSKLRFRVNALNLLAFFAIVGLDVTRANFAYSRFIKGKNATWARQNLVETLATWGITVGLALVDWRRALFIVLVPHLYAVWGITTVNFLQHDGCDPHHPTNHSRNFVGKIFNWVTFNNGFHGIHHLHPGLHWSLLPEAHAREAHPTIHPALEQKSLALYLLRTFLWPGRRLTFDGKPVVLPARGPDEDWIGGTIAPDPLDTAS